MGDACYISFYSGKASQSQKDLPLRVSLEGTPSAILVGGSHILMVTEPPNSAMSWGTRPLTLGPLGDTPDPADPNCAVCRNMSLPCLLGVCQGLYTMVWGVYTRMLPSCMAGQKYLLRESK